MNFEKQFDILVIGGGVAGVAGALEAARDGLHVALVEKTVQIGGLATGGLINIYLPLCDGLGHQVTFGIAEELLHSSIRYGPGDVPPGWPAGGDSPKTGRYQTIFSPASFALALDEVLIAAGVEIWLDTLVCLPLMDGNRVAGVKVENKSGRGVLRGQCVIDATGDADIAYRAGAPCAEGNNWLSLWGIETSLEAAEQAITGQDDPGTGRAPLLGGVRIGAGANGENAISGAAQYTGIDGAQASEFVLEGRRHLREHYARLHAQGGKTSRHHRFPVTLPAMAQFRTTRRIVGRETLIDGQNNRRVETSVGLAPDWRKAGPVWEIPYGALVPQGVSGLLAAGRCISSAGDAWEVTRVIPVAALTGQVAGLAATLAVQQRTTPDQIQRVELQQKLEEKGIALHIEDVARQGRET
ncbi:MAG: FAD-dependent oxidoreductase [Anaerolineae bacterium]|nr:FAD-dependent oxidoreductase [Anaerolineae bacterium]